MKICFKNFPYRVLVLDTQNLNPEKKRKYSLFTTPKFRCCLEGKDPYDIGFTEQIAIGIEKNSEPIGLALASLFKGLDYAEIHTINIDIHYKKPNILKNFISEIEKKLFSQNANYITYRFSPDTPIVNSLVPVLEENSWASPKLVMIRYFYDAQAFNPPWYDRPPLLPSGYKTFKWETIRDSELEKIKKDYKQGYFTDHVSPFWEAEKIEPVNSIGLRYKNQVIGWMICHRVAHDTIRYTAFYVKHQFAFTGYPLRLLVDSMKLHQTSTIKWALFELNFQDPPTSWINFVLKRLAPLAQAQIPVYETWKQRETGS
ncbi:putative uncharacterized protein [Waddlia chondrophila 2032/99]|uniref:N-acetyltransferase domain-containing protein n=2 Tax=Waddlia chondrophila TaxID=71667 RepID=D6YSA0_WADCW|nr:hypothetical protein [Waddlia chondrophila]ADI38945.1 hypothetical protein wcw_1600 [Waddlia chondrophila WSU 86-1044]CCB92065.1 putative uncharacterized protein [Waddlia chondrophila 2032/99]